VKSRAVHTVNHPPIAGQQVERIEVFRSLDSGSVEYILVNGKMFVPQGFAELSERPQYAPNKKYQDEDFKRFEYWYEVKQSQELAYDELVRENPGRFDAGKFKSFIAGYRVWLRGKANLAFRQSKLG
jgi:hypothetical protein